MAAMFPDIIHAALIIMAIVAATIYAGWRVCRGITKDREPEPEPETYGDDGGRPPAPEIGSGLQAGGKLTPMTHMEAESDRAIKEACTSREKTGDAAIFLMEPGSWPAYGLKRLDGHKRGRVEVTGKGGRK